MKSRLYKSHRYRHTVGKKSAEVHARSVRRGIAIASITIALALAFVWTRVRVIQVGYDVTKLNRQVQDLSEQSNELQVEIAKLKAPERLEHLASEYFHMRLPQGDEIVFLTSESSRNE